MSQIYKVIHTQTIEYGVRANSLEQAEEFAKSQSQYDLLWDDYICNNCLEVVREVSYDPDFGDECVDIT